MKAICTIVLFFSLNLLLQAQDLDLNAFAKGFVTSSVSGVNSDQTEFAPAFYKKGIIYVTSNVAGANKDKNIKQSFFNLMIKEGGEPSYAFSADLNSSYHEGPVAFDERQGVLYLTRNNLEEDRRKLDQKGVTRLKIYKTFMDNGIWERPVELSFCNDAYTVCHPTVHEKGLFFASDMPGGLGGLDLYYVEKIGNGWTEPQNLGPKINSSENDAFPFYHESGHLIFSSNRKKGKGGLDLYAVSVKDGKMSSVQSLTPFNTDRDDLSLIVSEDGQSGYFASNRKGNLGKDDIYAFTSTQNLFGENKVIEAAGISALVLDAQTKKAIPNAAIKLLELKPDELMNNEQIYKTSFSEGTDGAMQMKIETLTGFDEVASSFNTDISGMSKLPLQAKKQYILVTSHSGYKNRQMVIRQSNDAEHVIELQPSKNCSDLQIKILDAVSNSAISQAKIQLKPNCAGVVFDLLSSGSGSSVACLKNGCSYIMQISKAGYATKFDQVDVSSQGSNFNETVVYLEKIIPKKATPVVRKPAKVLTEGAVIVLENIYYDYNKATLRSGAAAELDELSRIMARYPSMEIELSSHTDSRGSARYNQKLSLDRANSAKSYLMARGISAQRIRAVGYGEAALRNRCADDVECSDDEHQYNRRTEVRVTKYSGSEQIQYGG